MGVYTAKNRPRIGQNVEKLRKSRARRDFHRHSTRCSYALAGSVEYEMAQCEPSDSTAVCGEVMRALCEGPEGEPRWAADVRLGDSVRIVRKTAQAPQPPGE